MDKFKKNTNFLMKEFFYGGHIPGLVGVAIITTESIIERTFYGISIFIVAYCIPLVIYSFNYAYEKKVDLETNPERARHLENMKKKGPYVFCIYVIALIYGIYKFNFSGIIFSLLLIFGGILFSTFFKHLTKKLTAFKNFYTALLWSLLIFLPTIVLGRKFGESLFLLPLFVFSRVFLNTVFFDIKDISSDRREGLQTIPIVIGIKHTILFLQVLNFFSFLPLVIGVQLFGLQKSSLYLISLFPYTAAYLFLSRRLNGYKLRAMSYFVADGEYLLWPLSLIFLKFFFGY